MDCSHNEVIKMVRENKQVMIAVDIKGRIKTSKPVSTQGLSNEEFTNLIRQEENKGCSVSFLDQDKNFDEKKLEKVIKESVECITYFKTQNTKPGINIPGENSNP